MWREATKDRCGWYGEDNIYASKVCLELGGTTLTQKIFFPPSIPLLQTDWQERCKFSPHNVHYQSLLKSCDEAGGRRQMAGGI